MITVAVLYTIIAVSFGVGIRARYRQTPVLALILCAACWPIFLPLAAADH